MAATVEGTKRAGRHAAPPGSLWPHWRPWLRDADRLRDERQAAALGVDRGIELAVGLAGVAGVPAAVGLGGVRIEHVAVPLVDLDRAVGEALGLRAVNGALEAVAVV